MKVTIEKRTSKKGENNRIRRQKNIPAVIYSLGKEGENITVNGADFAAVLREIRQGHLPTTVFSLVDSEGNERRAIVKDIQYHVTTYAVLHLDFEELHDNVHIDVKVPIHFVDADKCEGVKIGGVVRPVIRHYKVRCPSNQIPDHFTLSVEGLPMNKSRRLEAITLPEGVTPVTNQNDVAVIIAKR